MGGNITSKTKYAYTTATNPSGGTVISYEYNNANWPDLLTKYNGKTITSDAIGNMLSDGTWTYTWQNGRQLAGMTKAGTEIEYTYDSDGMRTSKTVNGTTTKYMYYGGQLVAMDTEFGPVYFHYDSTGVMAMEVQGTMLYYVKNAQGDIVALVDTNGYPVVEYTYDAWGNVINTTGLYATTYGVYNPFRYRGYVYDNETGLYYLSSRYYNSELCRFISTDDASVLTATPTELTDKNLFAYCDNNPVSRADYGGEIWTQVGMTLLGGIISAGAELAGQLLTGKKLNEVDWTAVAIEGVSGAATGLLMSVGAPANTISFTKSLINTATSVAHSVNEGDGIGETIFKATKTFVMGNAKTVGRFYTSGKHTRLGTMGKLVKKYALKKLVIQPLG